MESAVCGRKMVAKSGHLIAGFLVDVHGLDGEALEAWKEIYPELNTELQVGLCFICFIQALGAPVPRRRL